MKNYANICKAIFFYTTHTHKLLSLLLLEEDLLAINNLWRVVVVVVVVDPIHDAHCKLITLTTSFIPYHKTRNCIQFLARFLYILII
jgi:hypothetical protein